MSKERINHKYLLHLYSKVDESLTSSKNIKENLPDVIVSFCVVVEKIFKIKLHDINPVLVFEQSKIKDNDSFVSVAMNKEKNIETIKIPETIDRFKLVFVDIFSDDEFQALLDIYYIRNNFIHGYKPDDEISFEVDDVIKKMGTIWEKISNQAVDLFGKDTIKMNKPKKKYSEEELEKVLSEEVKKKIQSTGNEYDSPFSLSNFRSDYQDVSSDIVRYSARYPTSFGFLGEQCPRCGSNEFSLDVPDTDVFSISTVRLRGSRKNFSDLYKCKKCNLELTRKEYEIAKKLKE